MINKLKILFIPIFLGLFLAGCLTADFKEMRISLNEDGKSGTGTFIFTGISSEKGDDTLDQSKADFNSLITEYYQGKTLETAFPTMKNIKKRLFSNGDQLIGEITFDFDDINKMGIFRYKNSGPYMYYTLSDGYFTSGQFASSNGTYGGEKMPVVFWDETSKDFYLKMSMASPGAARVSLAKKFTVWEKK